MEVKTPQPTTKHDNSVLNILQHAKVKVTVGKNTRKENKKTYHTAPGETARQQNREMATIPTTSLLTRQLWSF